MSTTEVVAVASMRPGFGMLRSSELVRRHVSASTVSPATAAFRADVDMLTAAAKCTPKHTSASARLSTKSSDGKAEAGWQMPRGCPSCRERHRAEKGDPDMSARIAPGISGESSSTLLASVSLLWWSRVSVCLHVFCLIPLCSLHTRLHPFQEKSNFLGHLSERKI